MMMDSDLDQVTRSLFAQLRRDKADVEENDESRFQASADFQILICPKCSDRLEPLVMPVEIDPVTKQRSQVVWWTCRGLHAKTCNFPLYMPPDVFWARRTSAQIRSGLLPLPDLDRLPAHFHYFYPAYFRRGPDGQPAAVESMSRVSACAEPSPAVTDVNDDSEPAHCSIANNKRTLDQSSPLKRRTDVGDDRAKATAASDSVRYGSAASRRNVELFTDSNTALNSLIALKYQTDAFLSTINSEMSRKKLVRPPPAISSQQRRRLSNIMQRYRTRHGAPPPLDVLTVMRKRIVNDRRPVSPTPSLRSVLSLANVPAETLLPQAVAELFPASTSGAGDTADVPPSVTPPPLDPVNAKPSVDRSEALASASSAVEGHDRGVELDIQPSTSQPASKAVIRSSHPPPSAKTTSSDPAIQPTGSKSAAKRPTMTPCFTFDDPEIESVMKRSFMELRRTVFGGARKRRRQPKAAGNGESLSPAVLAALPDASYRGHATPSKRPHADTAFRSIDEAPVLVPVAAPEVPAMMDDDFAALHHYSQSGRAFERAAAAAIGQSHASVFQTDFAVGDEDGDLALRRAFLTHFNDDHEKEHGLLAGRSADGHVEELTLYGLEHF